MARPAYEDSSSPGAGRAHGQARRGHLLRDFVVRGAAPDPHGRPDGLPPELPGVAAGKLLDDLSLGYFRATTDGLILHYNSTLRVLLGLGTLGPSPTLDVQHLCVRPEQSAPLLHDIVAHGVQRHEIELYRLDGTPFWASITAVPDTMTSDGAVIHGVIEDATATTRVRDTLRAASGATGEEFLRWLVRHAAEALGMTLAFIAAIDPDRSDSLQTLAVWRDGAYLPNGRYALANTPCEKVLTEAVCCFPDRVAEDFPGTPLLCEAGVRSFLGRPLLFEGRIVGLMAVADVKPLDSPLGVAGVFEPFAERAGIEVGHLRQVRSFRDRSAMLAHTLASLSHPFYVIDVDNYEVVMANEAAFAGVAAIGHPCYALTHDRSRPCAEGGLACPIDEVRRARAPVKVEHVHLAPGGEERIYEVHAHPIFDEAGALKQVIEYNIDVTARRRAEEALHSSEARLRYLYQSSPVPMYSIDVEGHICDANHSLLTLTGHTAAELIGQPADFLGATPTTSGAQALLSPQFWRRGYIKDEPYTLLAKDGRQLQVSLCCVTASTSTGRRLNVSVACDAADAHPAGTGNRDDDRAELYALACTSADDGLWEWDLRTDEMRLSPRWRALLGCTNDERPLGFHEWLAHVHEDDVERLTVALSLQRDGLTPGFEVELRMRLHNGAYRCLVMRGLPNRDAQAGICSVTGSLADVSERRFSDVQLRHRDLHDDLTALPNRALFVDRLARAADQALRTDDRRAAVLLLDLDRFSLVNASLGRSAGDVLLGSVAKRLKACVTPRDTVARFGGDTFAMLLEDVRDVSDASRVAERCLNVLRMPFDCERGGEVFLSASLGIALTSAGESHASDLLHEADTAMHRAKARGGGQHALFDVQMHGLATSRLELETDLRHAVQQQAFRLKFQPIVDLANGRVHGFEALARWTHPRRGPIGPDEFIPLLEQTGLIQPFGTWALTEGCRWAREWRDSARGASPLEVSVNLSARQFLQPNLTAVVGEALKQTGANAEALCLEVTESTIAEDPEAAAQTLTRLRDMGVRLHLDDFGTGYSSLSYLHRFPFDALKVPGCFVERLDRTGDGREVVRAIVALSQALKLDVIAEAVETPTQLESLRALGCGYGQGWLFEHAVDPERCRALLDQPYAVC